MISTASSSHADPSISEYIAELTKQAMTSSRATYNVQPYEQMGGVIRNKLEKEFDQSGMQCLFVVTPHNPSSKKKLCEIMFEKYGV